MVRRYSYTVGLFIREGLIMYYCNGFWFDQYNEARRYADFLLNHARIYRAIFTRSEMDAHFSEAAQ
jgi:hypothetical protein